jgi:AcrR family transcriptional regulator
MVKRMAATDEQERTDRRQQILEAALKVFSTKGFHKATNKDIAEAAGGISPGLIYWYFKDKHDLFLSIIRERAEILQLADHPEQLMELPPREALALIGRVYLTALSSPGNVPLFRMMIGEAMRFPQLGDMVYKLAASRLLGVITRYLQLQIDQGRMRPHDTMIAARSFIGMLIIHILAREVLHQPEAIATPDEQVIATVVDIFVRGLESDG